MACNDRLCTVKFVKDQWGWSGKSFMVYFKLLSHNVYGAAEESTVEDLGSSSSTPNKNRDFSVRPDELSLPPSTGILMNRKFNHSPPSNDNIKNTWNFASTVP